MQKAHAVPPGMTQPPSDNDEDLGGDLDALSPYPLLDSRGTQSDSCCLVSQKR